MYGVRGRKGVAEFFHDMCDLDFQAFLKKNGTISCLTYS
jgi:hypothetical protein